MALELANSGMSDRQRKYRETYRSRIVGWYNGWLHVAVIYIIGFSAMAIYIQSMNDIRWYELLIVPVVFVGANFFEWFLHTHIMHRPQKNRALRAIYTRHTLMHHQFFTDEEMRFRDHKDWRVTFFPLGSPIIAVKSPMRKTTRWPRSWNSRSFRRTTVCPRWMSGVVGSTPSFTRSGRPFSSCRSSSP